MTDEEYYEFIQPYEDAKQMLLTRLDVLNHNLYGEVLLLHPLPKWILYLWNITDMSLSMRQASTGKWKIRRSR